MINYENWSLLGKRSSDVFRVFVFSDFFELALTLKSVLIIFYRKPYCCPSRPKGKKMQMPSSFLVFYISSI